MTEHPLIGAHQSIAGGHANAVDRAVAAGCRCLQLFVKNNLRWNDRAMTDEDARRFRAKVRQSGIGPVMAHASYLVNLASPDDDLFRKSISAMADEMQRCGRLGIRHIIVHPGAHMGSGVEAGVARVVAGSNTLLRDFPRMALLMETTAGAGTTLGGSFEELAAILRGVRARTRIGVCFDTCHVFAAGYDIGSPEGYRRTMRAFDCAVGLSTLRAFHFNDCAAGLGDRKDRHAHIGLGSIGDGGFRSILTDKRFRDIPKYLETPKKTPGEKDWDKINLARLRRLA